MKSVGPEPREVSRDSVLHVSDHLPSLVSVLGIGADGWSGLGDSSREKILAADVVIGAPRQLALLPEVDGQERCSWPRPFSLDVIEKFPGRPVLLLASGDPLMSGVATTLLPLLGERLEVWPAVSSTALARARMRWPEEDVATVSVVGRRLEPVLRELAPGRRLLVLSSDEHTPSTLADLLVNAGYGDSRLTVLGDLGGDTESRIDDTARGIAVVVDPGFPRLNVVAIACAGPVLGTWVGGLRDDAYEHDGQLTKRDVRASALARLAPQPGQRLWDVGAGAGSVAVEWLRTHPTCRADAVERNPDRVDRIVRNAAHLGVPVLDVHLGEALEVLPLLGVPDAIFVGGGATVPGLLDLCLRRLACGGRLVVHGVTLETEGVLARQYGELGGELMRIAVETADTIGSFTGWAPARAVTQWSWTKPSLGSSTHHRDP